MNQNNDSELTEQQKIQANAELVIRHMHDDFAVELKYDEAAVKWLDDYIEQTRNDLDQNTVSRLISIFGSFLGECIRHEYGGKWQQVNGKWGILFDSTNVAFPFAKMAKQFANGREAGDSIRGFYQSIPLIFNLKLLKDSKDE